MVAFCLPYTDEMRAIDQTFGSFAGAGEPPGKEKLIPAQQYPNGLRNTRVLRPRRMKPFIGLYFWHQRLPRLLRARDR